MKQRALLAYTGLVLALLFWAVLDQALSENSRAISDRVYLYALYLDVFGGGSGLEGWSLTPAPYLFPQGLGSFLALAITKDWGAAMVCYEAAFIASLVAMATHLGAKAGVRPLVATAWSATAFAALALASTTKVLQHWIDPGWHGGVIWAALAALCLIPGVTAGRWPHALAYTFVVAATLASDALALPAFIAPIFVVFRERAVWLSTLVGFFLAIGALAALPWLGVTLPLGRVEIIDIAGLRTSIMSLRGLFEGEHFVSPLSVILPACGLLFWRSGPIPRCLILGALANLAAAGLCTPAMGWSDGVTLRRHLVGFFVLPVIALGFVAPRKWVAGVTLGGALFLSIFGLGVRGIGDALKERAGRPRTLTLAYPDYARCVDEATTGLRFGIGPYTAARALTYNSRTGIRVVVGPEAAHWIGNIKWYRDGGAVPDYAFVVTDVGSRERMVQAFGEPTREKSCRSILGKDEVVLVYDPPANIALREAMAAAAEPLVAWHLKEGAREP